MTRKERCFMFLKKKTFRTALILVMTLMLALPAFTYAAGFDAPEGKTLTTNVRLTASDIQAFNDLKGLA